MKKTKFNPVYTVDITKCENGLDVKVAFALGKHNAGLPLKDEDIFAICEYVVNKTSAEYENVFHILLSILFYSMEGQIVEPIKKKTPWYKRFWNWMTKPFKKNK